MKVLVTGGSGFIGSYVVRRLIDLAHEPTIFDQRARHRSTVDTFLGDVRDQVAVLGAVASHDAVIHLAGVLGTQETIAEPLPAVETNIYGSINVFKACAQYERPCVFIAVGNHWMNNSYSITKTTAERFAFMFNKELGTRISVVRALNAYGPGQKAAPVRKIMPNLILPVLNGEPITIYGDGEQVMDMIYAADVADVLCRALFNDHGVYDRVFEAGTGRQTTVNEIAQVVIDSVGGGEIRHVPMRPGEPEHSVVVGDPATLDPLGHFDFTPLEDGVPETIIYYATSMR